jgi:DivIVA domain-containing protein
MLLRLPDGKRLACVTRTFSVVFGGYDTTQVDELLERVDHALISGSELERARARQVLRSVTLSRRLRGYPKRQVLRLLDQRARVLSSASAPRSR